MSHLIVLVASFVYGAAMFWQGWTCGRGRLGRWYDGVRRVRQ